jgi:hypothetical protein
MKKNQLLIVLAFVASLAILNGCRKKADVPADVSTYDPKLQVTHTILDLKVMAGSASIPYQFTDDIIVQGVVTADDRSGNFYKQIMIQDGSAGIPLLLERASLYNDYPIGRKLYIKCKGLYVGVYGGMKQLGWAVDNSGSVVGIPSALFTQFIVKANYPNPLPIRSFTLAQLYDSVNSDAMLGSLVRIDSNCEFRDAEIGSTFAQPSSIASATEREVQECGGNRIMDLRTSAYSKFYNQQIPSGRGSLTAIFSRYNQYRQLTIREVSDVQFTNPTRCSGVIVTPPTPITIKQLREGFTGTNMKMGNVQIHGTVISSIKDSTTANSVYYVQDESDRGINIYFPTPFGSQPFQLGDSVTINLNGDSLIRYSTNILELKNGPTAKLVWNLYGSGKTVTPFPVTVAQIKADLAQPDLQARIYESRLLKIINGTLTSTNGLYAGGSVTLTDPTDAITMWMGFKSPYNSTSIKTGTVSVVGIGANYNATPQILPRRLSDIQ